MPWFRLDTEPPKPKTLAKAGALAAQHGDVGATLRISDDASVVAGGASTVEQADLTALVDALQAVMGGTARHAATEDALDLAAAFPDEDAGMPLAAYAPEEPVGPVVPKGLYGFCTDWRDGAKGPAGWADLRHRGRRFVGNERLDNLLVRDMLAGWGVEARGSSAADLLRYQPEGHVTAALIERMRRGRGTRNDNLSRTAALRSLTYRDAPTALATLALESLADPGNNVVAHLVATELPAGALPAEVMHAAGDDATWLGWEPFDLAAELERRGLSHHGWLQAEEALLAGHEDWLSTMPPRRTSPAAGRDIRIALPVHAEARFLATLPPHEAPHREVRDHEAHLGFPAAKLPRNLATRRHYLVILAALAATERAQVDGPADHGTVDIVAGKVVGDPAMWGRLDWCLFRHHMWKGTPQDRLERAFARGYLRAA